MKEMNILKTILLAASKTKSRLFRANVGTAWIGNKIERITVNRTVIVSSGDVVIRQARPLNTGLPPGFPDLFGWTEIEITMDHVGKTLAVFTGAEVKTKTGRPSENQLNAINRILEAGGIAGVVRSDDDFVSLVTQK